MALRLLLSAALVAVAVAAVAAAEAATCQRSAPRRRCRCNDQLRALRMRRRRLHAIVCMRRVLHGDRRPSHWLRPNKGRMPRRVDVLRIVPSRQRTRRLRCKPERDDAGALVSSVGSSVVIVAIVACSVGLAGGLVATIWFYLRVRAQRRQQTNPDTVVCEGDKVQYVIVQSVDVPPAHSER